MKVFALVVLLAACGDNAAPRRDAESTTPVIEVNGLDGGQVDTLELGASFVGQSASAGVRLTNRGNAATGPIALSITGMAANEFSLDNTATTCAALALAPSESCDVVVVFRPTAIGAHMATLTIASVPGGTFAVGLSGDAAMPDLHFNPTSISFGRIEVGASAQTTIELRNDGNLAVPIDAISVAGVTFTRGASTCGAMLAPATSCDIAISAQPQALGPITGNISVTSAGTGYTAGLQVNGARKITVVKSGTGSGTVSSTPIGIDCGSTCSALSEGAVTLTAAPGANTQVTSWSIPSCGQASTCVVPADTTPVTVTISFTLTGSSSFALNFVGNGTGEVRVTQSGVGLLADCFSSCTIPVEPGAQLRIRAATFSTFGGFSGACAQSDLTLADCTYDVPVGPTTIDVTFNKDPKEQWTRFLPGTVDPSVAAFDGSGNLIIATTQKLTKLSPTGSTIWSIDMVADGDLATGPGDTIYVSTSGGLRKLAPDGTELWVKPTL